MAFLLKAAAAYAAAAALFSSFEETSAIIRRQLPASSFSIGPSASCQSSVAEKVAAAPSALAFVGGLKAPTGQFTQATAIQADVPASPSKSSLRLRATANNEHSVAQRPPSKSRVSDRISGALDFMRKTARKATSTRASLRDVPPKNEAEKRSASATKRGALSVRGQLVPEVEAEDDEDEEEDVDNDDDDEGDEELDADLEDEDDVDDTDEEYDPIAPRGPLENNNYGEVWLPVQARPRRNRKNSAVRRLVQESVVKPSSLIYPLFVHDEVRNTIH